MAEQTTLRMERRDRLVVRLQGSELRRLVIKALSYTSVVPEGADMQLNPPVTAGDDEMWEIVFKWIQNRDGLLE